MAEHGVPIDRVINAGGIPQNNPVLNQVYANVLNKPVLVPDGVPTSLGSGIFALLAAGTFSGADDRITAAQDVLCLPNRTYAQDPAAAAIYERLYQYYQRLYFAFGAGTDGLTDLRPLFRDLKAIASAGPPS